jgi:excisionase family DNA binding protein
VIPSVCAQTVWHHSCDSFRTVPQTLLIDDAAQLLKVSRRTVYYRIREGRLVTIRTKCGSQRVLVSSIQRLLQEMTGGPAGGAQRPETSDVSEPWAEDPAMGTGG